MKHGTKSRQFRVKGGAYIYLVEIARALFELFVELVVGLLQFAESLKKSQ